MEYNGYFIDIKKDLGESQKMYIDRCNFIANNLDDNSINPEDLINYSNIFKSIKYLGCEFNDEIYKKIKKLSEKANISFI